MLRSTPVEDIHALRYPPRMVNIKPSRLGGAPEICSMHLTTVPREGIGNYGGGQFELGVGRGQIQYLASLFHADAPNDVAPSGYNLPDPPAGLPQKPSATGAHGHSGSAGADAHGPREGATSLVRLLVG